MTFSITPLVASYGPRREKSRFTFLHNFGEKIDLPYVSWLVQSSEHGLNVLVDVGCSAIEYRQHIKASEEGTFRHAGEEFDDVVDVTPLDELLAQRGLGTDDIDFVILTHLDWDHCMNLPLFPTTRVLVQEREWAALPPHPFIASGFAPEYRYREMQDRGIEFIDGDKHIVPGLDVLLTPGHTDGGQSVEIETSQGKYVIAGLCTIWENYYPDKEVLKDAKYEVIPPGGHTDLFEAYNSVLRIRDLAGPRLLPVHHLAAFDMEPIV
jgi:glyoxylase-like metal-dependent hydrolase (beta-lactamase superfamily II)